MNQFSVLSDGIEGKAFHQVLLMASMESLISTQMVYVKNEQLLIYSVYVFPLGTSFHCARGVSESLIKRLPYFIAILCYKDALSQQELGQ